VIVPLVLVAVLVATSVPMQVASLAARAGRLAATRLFLFAALIVQAGYFAYEVHDYFDQLHTFDITRNAYSSIYYTLLGADQAIAWYWHAVNAITVAVTLTLLSAHL
jgi:heme/copper-type cytochrome/quinol oxidase subunit 3